ncbi:MAG: hypothetical protein B9S33_06640 [Pedosphaera sp. Tous-C6FEB]|nr:MAG: hypothetical protein B9S33_06640 [Pedosphaera sp. Tous-C6FEB]
MNAAETATVTGAPETTGQPGTPERRQRTPLRRAPARSLVLAQSWIPFSVGQRGHAGIRQSTLRAAQAFTLLSSQLATRRAGGNVISPLT